MDIPSPSLPPRHAAQEARDRIKQTVQRCAPQAEIDQTKVLTDEELAILKKQYEERKAAEKLASENDRQALRTRLKQAVQTAEMASFVPTSVLDPEELKRRLDS